MNTFVPQVLADQLRMFALMVPQEAQWPVFAVLLTVYVFAAVKLICLMYCWLDYVVATATRHLGFSPVGIHVRSRMRSGRLTGNGLSSAF